MLRAKPDRVPPYHGDHAAQCDNGKIPAPEAGASGVGMRIRFLHKKILSCAVCADDCSRIRAQKGQTGRERTQKGNKKPEAHPFYHATDPICPQEPKGISPMGHVRFCSRYGVRLEYQICMIDIVAPKPPFSILVVVSLARDGDGVKERETFFRFGSCATRCPEPS